MAKRKDNPAPLDIATPAAGAADRISPLPDVDLGLATASAAPARTDSRKSEMPQAESLAAVASKPSAAAAPPQQAATMPPRAGAALAASSADAARAPRAMTARPAQSSRSGRFALLAASVALAAATGAVAGSLGSVALMPPAAPPTQQAAAPADDVRALKESIVRLSSELATVKAGLDNAAKMTSGHFAKLTERLDRAEKAHAEPAAKIAKIAESVERLEKRQPADSDVTGSIPAAPAEAAKASKPAIVDGWIVADIYRGRALLESRRGMLLEVGPGSTIPGVGRVEAVERRDGRWVVVTPKGWITSYR